MAGVIAEQPMPSEGVGNGTSSFSGGSNAEAQGKFRLVALDMDGTLLRPDHKISQYAIDYLNYLHQRGILIVIATGRSVSSVFDTISEINLEFTHDNDSSLPTTNAPIIAGFPLVCSNGSCGLKVSSCGTLEKPLFYEPVTKDVTKKTIALANKLGLPVQYYLGKDIHVHTARYSHRNLVRRYSNLTGMQQKEVKDQLYENILDLGLPSKLLVLCEEERLDEVTATIQNELGHEAHIIRGTPPFFVEILHKSVCKGHGLRRLIEALNEEAAEKESGAPGSSINDTSQSNEPLQSSHTPYSMHQVVAFGDGDNDIEFLQFAGRGIAMKNARDSLKQVADEVICWTNAEDGVIQKLQQMEREGLLALDEIKS
jgi:hydroxymethylpyrimidine pyrophosphatase-like HAD family hydrolase